MVSPNKWKLYIAKCNQIRAKNKEEQIARAIAQLKIAELSSEPISKLEILCKPDGEVAEATDHHQKPTGWVYLTLVMRKN
jgi:hypothetical protein